MQLAQGFSSKHRVCSCTQHGMSPIPQEGRYDEVKDVYGISGFSHSVGTCALKQGRLQADVKR